MRRAARHEYGDYRKRQQVTQTEALSAYRPVIDTLEQRKRIGVIQTYLAQILHEKEFDISLGGAIHKLPADGLRISMMPKQDINALQPRGSSLGTSARVQKRILRDVPQTQEPILGVKGTRGLVLNSGKGSLAALVFEDPRLVAEQLQMAEAFGGRLPKYRTPAMTVATMTRLPLKLARSLAKDLTLVAPSIVVATEQVVFEHGDMR